MRAIISFRLQIGFIIGFVFAVGLSPVVYAQTDPIIEGSDVRPFTASGSIGLSANTYTATGIENRRSPASLKTTANLNFSLFGFSSGLNVLYSTDQSKFRQNMNNISFDASWKWLTIQAGDVSPNFSRYGIGGATIRGGYLKLDPGSWLLELTGGQSKREISNTGNDEFREPAFERWSMAGKIGYENDNDDHFYLSSHYSLDKSRSLQNQGTIAPQENFTVTPDVGVKLFDGAFSLESQVTFSAYTRDLNTAEIPISDLGLPGFLAKVIQPHVSSRLNYAGQASAMVNLDSFGAEFGYERIQPGFRSLGIGQMQDDQEKIRFAPSVQLLDNRMSVQSNVVLGRDNLLNSRLKTRRTTGIGTNVQFQLTDMIVLNSNYNLLINNFSSNSSSSQDISPDQKQVAHTFMLQPSVTIQAEQKTHNISLSASYFTFNIDFESNGSTSAPMSTTSDTYSSSATYSLMFPGGFTVNAMGNFLLNKSRSTENNTLGGNVGASYSFLERKLTMSLNGGFNQNLSTTSIPNASDVRVKSQQFMLSLTGNYRLTGKDTFSLSVRSRGNNVVEGGNTNYSELEASLKYRHQF